MHDSFPLPLFDRLVHDDNEKYFNRPCLEPAKFILKEGKNPKVINTVIAVEKSE
jgi:hypothetical protein